MGIGSEGSIEDARRFVDAYGVRSPRMLWDERAESWRELRVPGTPAAVLVDGRGRELGRWYGRFDEEEVLRRAATARAG